MKALKFIGGCILISVCLYGLYTADRIKSGIIFGAGYSAGAAQCNQAT